MRRLDGRVGAGGAHRDPHVGLRERGRVIDAVTDHGHDMALALQVGDRADLVCRQDLSLEVEPEPTRDRFRDLTPVAGEQQKSSKAQPPQGLERWQRFGP